MVEFDLKQKFAVIEDSMFLMDSTILKGIPLIKISPDIITA